MKNFIVVLALSVSVATFAQAPVQGTVPTKPVDITPLEKSEISNKLKDKVILQQQYKIVQRALTDLEKEFAEKDAALHKYVEDVKKAHKYGDDVTLDEAQGTLVTPITPVTPPAKPATVETPKK